MSDPITCTKSFVLQKKIKQRDELSNCGYAMNRYSIANAYKVFFQKAMIVNKQTIKQQESHKEVYQKKINK